MNKALAHFINNHLYAPVCKCGRPICFTGTKDGFLQDFLVLEYKCHCGAEGTVSLDVKTLAPKFRKLPMGELQRIMVEDESDLAIRLCFVDETMR